MTVLETVAVVAVAVVAVVVEMVVVVVVVEAVVVAVVVVEVVAVEVVTVAPSLRDPPEAAPPPSPRVGPQDAPVCCLGTTACRDCRRVPGRASLSLGGGGEAGWEVTRRAAPLGAPEGGRDVQSWPRNLERIGYEDKRGLFI